MKPTKKTASEKPLIILTAGGTGGHVSPRNRWLKSSCGGATDWLWLPIPAAKTTIREN